MAFDQQRPQPRAACGIRRGAQQRRFVRDDPEQDRIGIHPQFGKAADMQPPARAFRRLGAQPQQRHRLRHQRQRDRETRPARSLLDLLREYLVKPPARQPNAEPRIRSGTRPHRRDCRRGTPQPGDQG
jgi:hypothetical protein